MPETAPPAERGASCECGALRLHVTGDPVHVHGCTCNRCQRSTGSMMKLSAWFAFRSGDYLRGTTGIAVGGFADPAFPAPDHVHWWADRPHWLGHPLGPTLLEGN